MSNELLDDNLIPVTPFDFANQVAGQDRAGNEIHYGQRVINVQTLLATDVGPTTNLDAVIDSRDEKDLVEAISNGVEINTSYLTMDIGGEKIIETGELRIVLRRSTIGYTFEMLPSKNRKNHHSGYYISGVHPINWYHTIPHQGGALLLSNTEDHESIIVSNLQLENITKGQRLPSTPFNFVDTKEDVKSAVAHRFNWVTEEDFRLAQCESAYIEELERQIAKITRQSKPFPFSKTSIGINDVNNRLLGQLYGSAIGAFNNIGRGPEEISYLAHYDYFSLFEIASKYYGIPLVDLTPAERKEYAFEFLLQLEERIRPMEDILRKYEELALGYSPIPRVLAKAGPERLIIDDGILEGNAGLCYQGQSEIVVGASQLATTIVDDETADNWIERLAEIAMHERGHLLSHRAQAGFEYEEIFIEARIHLARYLMDPENYFKYYKARYDQRVEYNDGVTSLGDNTNSAQGAERLALETIMLAKKADTEDIIVDGRKLTGENVIASMVGTSATRRLHTTDNITSTLKMRLAYFGDLYDLTHETKFIDAFVGCRDSDYVAYSNEHSKVGQKSEIIPKRICSVTAVENWLIQRGVICPKEFGE